MRRVTAKNMEKAIKAFVMATAKLTDAPFETQVGQFKTLVKVCTAANNVNPTDLHIVLTGQYMSRRNVYSGRGSYLQRLKDIHDDLKGGMDIHATVGKYLEQATILHVDESALVLPDYLV
jgi:hypothetical protein